MLWHIFTKRNKVVEDKGAISCFRHGFCSEKNCPLWVQMTTTFVDKEGKNHPKDIGKCTLAWTPQLLIELKEKIGN